MYFLPVRLVSIVNATQQTFTFHTDYLELNMVQTAVLCSPKNTVSSTHSSLVSQTRYSWFHGISGLGRYEKALILQIGNVDFGIDRLAQDAGAC